MICSARELGLGDDHHGILVLPPATADVGADAVVGARAARRGARHRRHARPWATPCRFAASPGRRPRRTASPSVTPPTSTRCPQAGDGHPGAIDDPTAADRLVLRTVTGLDPHAPSPLALQRRLLLSGMRPVSLAVDVTNYVMLEMGQPLHAFDRTRLDGPIVVRRARAGERLETLDHVTRHLDPEDVAHHRRHGPGRAGRDDGRHDNRDRRELDRPGDRGRALQPRGRGAHVAAAQAVQRGGQAVRARRRP